SGATTINSGTLSVSADVSGTLGFSNPSQLGASGTLRINGGTLLANGSFTLNSGRGITVGLASGVGVPGTIAVAASQTLNYGGPITNTAGNQLVVGNSGNTGTLVLTGTNTFAGETAVNFGTLQAGGPNAFSPNSPVWVGASGTLALNG